VDWRQERGSLPLAAHLVLGDIALCCRLAGLLNGELETVGPARADRGRQGRREALTPGAAERSGAALI
jgi:hypothetical protein